MTTKNIKPGLYIIATPIGNLGDITYRAIETLSASDIILCEDTRTSKKLLDAYNIKSKLESLHEFNERAKTDYVIEKLSEGKVISLISDAGTPLVSDPGFNLVKSCGQKGFYITTVPGACSAITALTLSSFPTNKFFFSGFLPVKTMARTKILTNSKAIPSTLIFFETANRLEKCLIDVAKVFPESKVAVAKELTKIFESVVIDTAENLIEKIHTGQIVLKGEIVLLIDNSSADSLSQDASYDEPDIDAKTIRKMAADLHKKDTLLTGRKIAKILSAQLQIHSSYIYKILNDNKK
ncbi:MAG: 16S rRNA (cytidine(1402)-2'-O)-methyltransferase [Rickettsiales bacterium]|jgi:16S rRNA (cytidine1402-2'-O)-methyltransferase|nr:16S rRNA (cytidine(1402)-2'-O)-methyltransferase [Rickettsiales bacterium]